MSVEGLLTGTSSILRSKGGQRFGFVRYKSLEDALRAQERLDGFHIYGSRVRVHLARLDFNSLQGRNKDPWRKKIDKPYNRRAEENSDVLRRVSAVLDSDKRTILNNCLIGRCKKLMRADILAKEFHEQAIEDFCSWIACHEVPIHAWSESTFSNIAALWGDIISIDERTLKPTSFYGAYFQILTRISERINETVELVIGSKEAKSSENCMSINSKENQRVNEDVGNFQNDSSGFSDENSRTDSSMEARETTGADVESRDAPFGFFIKSVSKENEVPDIEKEAHAIQLDLEGVKGGVDICVEAADDIVADMEQFPVLSSEFPPPEENLVHGLGKAQLRAGGVFR
ncbi:hypothetical protein V6N11_052412 [Hibiscus sabdariffa]|uniref:RRM domain-containing protein n=1 Tax=Hibiscus sabdariffa TaxID=183260 RepID=A0ABR2UA14_9ROSI